MNVDRVAGALLGIALLLLIRRYAGINHDSVLYLGQALLKRWPEIYGNDLFFLHVNQGNFTLLPWLINQALAWVAPPDLFMWATLACLAGFSAAGYLLLASLLPGESRYWAWLGVLCLPSMYGMVSMFGYSEQFLTPRSIAESFCLLTVWSLARRNWIAAFACLALAGMFHPLQTIAAATIVWAWLVMHDRRWLHAAWLGIPVIAASMAGVAPFNDLFRRIDAVWLRDLREFTGQLFVADWGVVDYAILTFDALVLAYAWKNLQGRFGEWCAAALAGLALGIGSSLLLVDMLHLTLPAGLQLWRVHWLAHWFAMAAIPLVLRRDLQARDWPRAALLALVCLLVWQAIAWAWIPLVLLYWLWPRILGGEQNSRIRHLLAMLFMLGLAAMFAIYLSLELMEFGLAHHRLDLYAIDRRILAFPLFALGLPLLAMHAWSRIPLHRRPWIVIAVLCPLVVLGAVRWDARPVINLAFEKAAFREDLFGPVLPSDAQVYWDSSSLTGPWLTLRRASYFNPGQLAGVIFDRETAIDGRARVNRISALALESLECQNRERPYQERLNCRIGNGNLRQACAPGFPAPPDYLILPYRQAQRALGKWEIMDPVEHEPALTFWLYACKDIMAGLQGASG